MKRILTHLKLGGKEKTEELQRWCKKHKEKNDMGRFFDGFLGLPGNFVLTVLLSCLAAVLALCFRTKDRYIAMAAMLLSTVGDILLMNFRGWFSDLGVPYFILGAAFFAVAHIVYVSAFLSLIKKRRYKLNNTGFRVGIILTLSVFVFISALYFSGDGADFTSFMLCVLYLCIIGANCSVIFSFSFSAKSVRSLAAVGAFSFFLSDLIIGINYLAPVSFSSLNEYIWVFYPIGQLLIVLFA